MARKLVVEIIGDASSLERAYAKADRSSKGFSSSLGKVGKAAAFAGGAAAIGGLALVLKRGADEFNETQKVAAQTAAGIKSTGGAAKVTAKHVSDLATSISKYSAIDDEAVQAGENMILTFTNIRNEVGKGNDIFDQANRAVADLATKMNNGAIPSADQLKTSSIQLGKALNDPVKGIGALKRVGVTFTEAQKKLIEKLVKSGKTLEAQKVILKELRKEFGGSAKAAGSTFAGQVEKLKNSFDELSGRIFAKLVPALEKVIGFLSDLLDIFSGSGLTTDKFKKALERMGVSAETAQRVIDDLTQTFEVLKTVVVRVFRIIQPIIEAWWGLFRKIVTLLDDLVHGRWKKIFGDLSDIVTKAFGLIKAMVTTAISTWGGLALKAGKAILNGIVNGVKGLAGKVGEKILALGDKITGLIGTAKSWGVKLGKGILDGIKDGLLGLGQWILDKIAGPINALIRAANVLPGVNIPEIGKPSGGGSGGTAGTTQRGGTTTPGGGHSRPSTFNPIAPPVTSPKGGRGTAAVVFNGPVNVHGVQDPQTFIKWAQNQARVTSPSRSGPFGGHNVGLT